jgi:hypothetical protein
MSPSPLLTKITLFIIYSYLVGSSGLFKPQRSQFSVWIYSFGRDIVLATAGIEVDLLPRGISQKHPRREFARIPANNISLDRRKKHSTRIFAGFGIKGPKDRPEGS